VITIPDPSDRSRPWCGSEPSYLTHHRVKSSLEIAPNDWQGLIRAYSEAIPNLEALRLLATLSPLVEIGAGTGYWARLLQDLGTDVVAYDLVTPEINDWTAKLPAWTEVRTGDACFAVRQHPDRTPFACWPPRPSGYMKDVLRVYKGTTLALITDGRFMTDQPDPLYDALERYWILHQRVELPHWPGRRDSLMIWRR
jgi:hypothetical protein